jgi:hypothetical protein
MNRKLLLIKTIHTVIWVFFVLVIGYILYASIAGKLDFYLYAAIVLIVLEGIILLVFQWRCLSPCWAINIPIIRDGL